MPAAALRAPFGRLLTAMVTPFDVSGALDLDAAVRLAAYLVDEQHNDGLVISGTTGESPTTSDVPVMLYDIPGRTGTPIATETMLDLAGHDRIVAVKDAKGDLVASARVMAESDLAFYSGEDALTLPLLSVGAVGIVGTSTHFSGARTKQLIEAHAGSDPGTALRLHRELLPIYTGIFRTAGTILVKAGLRERGIDVGPVRPPLVDATDQQVAQLRDDLAAAGL
jgi:4-hydroxy-tetrahydrodipicolinate synthase